MINYEKKTYISYFVTFGCHTSKSNGIVMWFCKIAWKIFYHRESVWWMCPANSTLWCHDNTFDRLLPFCWVITQTGLAYWLYCKFPDRLSGNRYLSSKSGICRLWFMWYAYCLDGTHRHIAFSLAIVLRIHFKIWVFPRIVTWKYPKRTSVYKTHYPRR